MFCNTNIDINDQNGGMYFLDAAPGDAREKFLVSMILAQPYGSQNNIALAIAPFRIAANVSEVEKEKKK